MKLKSKILSVGIWLIPTMPALFAQSNQHFYFEENKGQILGADAGKVLYTFNAKDLSIFLLKTGLVYQFTKIHYPKDIDLYQDRPEKILQKLNSVNDVRLETYRMDVTLVDANLNATLIEDGKSVDYCKYYQGKVYKVHNYKKITYKDVYPNIDWVIYKSGNSVKYDFIVRPGGNPTHIKLKTQNVEELKSNSDGGFTMINRMGTVTEHKPVSYQQSHEIKTKIKIEGEFISFDVGHYDFTQDLVIDPELDWSTYYGGNGSDIGHSVSVDKNGNVYLAGYTQSTNNIASGGYQNSFIDHTASNFNNFLVKFSKEGVRQWATYYGAIFNTSNYKASSATDPWGNIYLASTTSLTTGVSSNGHQDTFGGGFTDAYLVKFDSMGNRLWATYYGGNSGEIGYGCATDFTGAVYLCGFTYSESNISFAGHKNVYGGDGDPFLVKFDKDGIRQWATYYGGDNTDIGYGCAVDGAGSVYLTGNAYSQNGIAFQGHQSAYGGAYIVKFNSVGVRQWGTYYGLNYNDRGNACATDGSGAVYMAGTTSSLSNIASNGFQNIYGGGIDDAFLVKFNSAGVRQWGTYYGGNGNSVWGSENGRSCGVSSNGAVYLSGNSSSQTGIGYEGYQDTLGGGPADAFLAKFNSQTGDRIWGSYFGGAGGEYGYECVSDENSGSVYLCGMTKTQNGLISGGHQEMFGGSFDDAFLVKLRDDCLQNTNLIATLTATPSTPVATGTSVVFNLTLFNQGLFPTIKWYKNNVLLPSVAGLSWTGIVGTDFQNNDEINVKIISNSFCADIDSVASNVIKIQESVGIDNIKAPDDFSIYPNPAYQYLSILGLKKGDHVEMLNTIGQKVYEISIANNNRLILDFNKYTPGVYLFKFSRGHEQRWSTKISRIK